MNAQIDSKRVVQKFINALQDGDLDALRASFGPDSTWWVHGSLPVAGTHHGPTGIVDQFLALSPFQPGSVKLVVTNAVAEREFVSVEWVITGRSENGQPYENFYNVMFEVREQTIAKVREYTDTLYAFEVLFGGKAIAANV